MCVYHPPDPSYDEHLLLDFLSDFCETTLYRDPNAKLVIAGDINQLKIHELLRQHPLYQMVKSATRGDKILDVFVTNNPFLWKTPVTRPSLVRSDHHSVITSPAVLEKPERKHVYFRDTREHRKAAMDSMLATINWNTIALENPSESVKKLNDTLWHIYDSCFPLIRVKVSTRDPPYMSPLVKLLCKKRNRLKSNDIDLQERINKLIRENQINAVSNKKQKYNMGSKGWWKMTNNITGRKFQDVQVSAVIDPKDINNFFQTISTDNEYVCPEPVVIEQGTHIPTVDVHEVWELLIHQKRTACGPDNVPYWIWRDFAHHLAPVITTIFNNSILKQDVPLPWKIANVTPIPKVSPLESCDQLRPISLTNIITRMFERLIYKKELAQPLKDFIGSDQFAYKANHNTTMALIKNQHYWLKSLDSGADFVRVFTFDFRKAFDSVSHAILCSKLKSLSINPYVTNWIISFLKDRKQRVVVDGIQTDLVDINKGVPQGTVLGPVLFTIMVNDIAPVCKQRSLMTKFADDITLSVAVAVRGNTETQDPSEQEVSEIKKWAKDNKMDLHMKKTWEMLVRGKTKKPPPREVDGIERKPELKILGITFSEDPCNWDTQFDHMLSKASSRMYILRV